MRATMSLPGIFPPIEVDGRVFVDGGVLDNIPTRVVKDLGVTRTIAVNVGDLADLKSVNYTVLGMLEGAVGTMMRANSVQFDGGGGCRHQCAADKTTHRWPGGSSPI